MEASNASTDTYIPSFDELIINKTVKQRLVIESIAKNVASSSCSNNIFLKTNTAIANDYHLS